QLVQLPARHQQPLELARVAGQPHAAVRPGQGHQGHHDPRVGLDRGPGPAQPQGPVDQRRQGPVQEGRLGGVQGDPLLQQVLQVRELPLVRRLQPGLADRVRGHGQRRLLHQGRALILVEPPGPGRGFLLKMDFRETAEQAMLREAVAKIAADYGHDYFLAKAKAGEKTTELWRAVSQAGFAGGNLPAEHGGGGMGISELAIVTEELAAHGCPLLLLMVSPAICGTLPARVGTPAQRERWLPPIASGEAKMVFAITEPDAGSNTHRLDTVATRDGDGWRLSGRKYYISGVDEADAVLVVTR